MISIKKYRVHKLNAIEMITGIREYFCVCCGVICECKNIDLHHIDSNTKVASPSSILMNGHINAYYKECKKCIPLCKECHTGKNGLHSIYGKEVTAHDTFAYINK